MSLLNGISSAGAGLSAYGADVAKDESAKEAAASLLNNALPPATPAAATPPPTSYGDPALPGPRLPAGPNPYTGPHAAALWQAELATSGPESGGKANAQNPITSAGGKFQIIDSTFKSALDKMGMTVPQSQDELNALKYNPEVNTAVMRHINTEAAVALDAKGLPVNVQTLQAAHRLGAVGAADAIQAAIKDPNTPLVGSGLAANAVRGNADIAGLTVGQFLANPYPRSGG